MNDLEQVRTESTGCNHLKINKAAQNEALFNSGFFVHVRHADKPLWRFFSRDADLLRTWQEVLA